MSGVCVHRFHARAAQTGAPRASPVYGAPGLHLHPVQGKVDLPHEGGHPLHHRVRHAQDHGRLPPHDAVGTPESAPAPRGPWPVPLAPPLRSRPQPPNFTFRRHPLSRRHGHHQGPGRTVPGQLSTASWPGSPAASGQRLWESLGAPPTTSCGAQTTHKAPSLAASQAPASTMCHEDQSGGRDGAGGLRRRVRPRGRRQGSGAWSLEKHGGEVQGGLGRNTRVPVC